MISILFLYQFFSKPILFSYQNFSKPIPILFSIPIFFETDTDTFSNTKFFRNRYRYHQKTWEGFETETFYIKFFGPDNVIVIMTRPIASLTPLLYDNLKNVTIDVPSLTILGEYNARIQSNVLSTSDPLERSWMTELDLFRWIFGNIWFIFLFCCLLVFLSRRAIEYDTNCRSIPTRT